MRGLNLKLLTAGTKGSTPHLNTTYVNQTTLQNLAKRLEDAEGKYRKQSQIYKNYTPMRFTST